MANIPYSKVLKGTQALDRGGALPPMQVNPKILPPTPHFGAKSREEEEEERSLIVDLKRHTQLAVAWNRHGSLVPRWT